jgi:hypothetical protein
MPTRCRIPPRQLTRVGGLEPIEPDDVDHSERLVPPGIGRHAPRLETKLDVSKNVEPRQQRKALEDHRHALARPDHRPAAITHLAFRGRDQAGQDPQQRGLTRARLTEKRDDLAFVEDEVDLFEDREFSPAPGKRKALAHLAGFEERRGHHAARL